MSHGLGECAVGGRKECAMAVKNVLGPLWTTIPQANKYNHINHFSMNVFKFVWNFDWCYAALVVLQMNYKVSPGETLNISS